jgi:hypothetical protein
VSPPCWCGPAFLRFLEFFAAKPVLVFWGLPHPGGRTMAALFAASFDLCGSSPLGGFAASRLCFRCLSVKGTEEEKPPRLKAAKGRRSAERNAKKENLCRPRGPVPPFQGFGTTMARIRGALPRAVLGRPLWGFGTPCVSGDTTPSLLRVLRGSRLTHPVTLRVDRVLGPFFATNELRNRSLMTSHETVGRVPSPSGIGDAPRGVTRPSMGRG